MDVFCLFPLLPVFPCSSLDLNLYTTLAMTRMLTPSNIQHFIQGPGSEEKGKGKRDYRQVLWRVASKKDKRRAPFPASSHDTNTNADEMKGALFSTHLDSEWAIHRHDG